MSKEKNKIILGAILISISSILWGFDGIVLTPRLSNLNVIFVVFMLHAIPFFFMNIFLFRRYKLLKELSKVEIFSLLAVAFLGGAFGTIAIVKALFLVNFQQLSIVVLLQKLQPVFAFILAATFLKEKISPSFILWAILALIGGYFLTFGINLPDFAKNQNTTYAALLSVFAAFAFGSSTVFSKKLLERIDFVTATFFRFGATFFLMLIVVLVSGTMFEFSAVTSHNWLILFIISITTGSGAILLYYYGMKNVKAIIATVMELFFPISAIFFDYFFNDSVLTPTQWISAIVMIFAILMINFSNLKKA